MNDELWKKMAEVFSSTLTEREIKEIYHALFYEKHLNHGTAGHNQLLLIAKMAGWHGFSIGPDNIMVNKHYK